MTNVPKNRVNLEKSCQVYEQACARFASNPALGKTTIRAVAKLLEDMHIEGHVGTFHLESDEPAVRGGTNLGPTPLALLRRRSRVLPDHPDRALRALL
jgi:hypothetical protein